MTLILPSRSCLNSPPTNLLIRHLTEHAPHERDLAVEHDRRLACHKAHFGRKVIRGSSASAMVGGYVHPALQDAKQVMLGKSSTEAPDR